jgi:LPS export ABC transporter protein LptC
MAAVSRRYAQGAVLAIVLGLSAVLIVGIWKGKTRQDKQEVSHVDTSEAEMKLTDMDYTEMEGGKRLWTLNAAEARYYQKEQKTILTKVRVTFFLRTGEEIHLQSKEGILYAGSKNVELWGAVHAELPHGYEMTTERAFYEHQNQTISSKTPVHVTGPDIQLDGAVWEYNIPDYRAVMEKGVQATVVSLSPRAAPKK